MTPSVNTGAAAEPPGGQTALAARIEALIRENAGDTEIVRFANDREHPVKVVRGINPPATLAISRPDRITAFSGMINQPVRILRGAPAAAGAAVAPVTPVSNPDVAAVQVVSFGNGAESVTLLRGAPARIDRALPVVAASPGLDLFGEPRGTDLDRIAFAVDGAESSHGADLGMWRPEPAGPQGPMQVSAAAAIDAGGGDRFDLVQNRQLGRAYLARLFRRYGNWLDAVAAYNWGPGNVDSWIAQGRPSMGLPLEVERYRQRVLHDGGIPQPPGSFLSRIAGKFSPP